MKTCTDFNTCYQSFGFQLHPEVAHYAGSTRTSSEKIAPTDSSTGWQLSTRSTRVTVSEYTGTEYLFAFNRTADTVQNVSLGILMHWQNWSRDHYVLMPGAAYAGNRFDCEPVPYPPAIHDPRKLGTDTPITITDVPRLNIGEGESLLEQLTRDCTTPMIAVWNPSTKQSVFFIVPHATRLGDSLLEVSENADRSEATLGLRAPGVRQKHRYSFCSTTAIESPDSGATFPKGSSLVLRVQLFVQDCSNMTEFYRQFFALRKNFSGERVLKNTLPFSAALDILEDKYNREHWDEERSYYTVGTYREGTFKIRSFDWQTGWVGGLMFTHPQLFSGTEETRQRALSTLDWAMRHLPTPCGLFYGGWHEGAPYGDYFADPSKPWVMTRKIADALYFMLKQVDLLQKQNANWSLSEHWKTALKNCAHAFCKIWDTNGQIGQLVNTDTGAIEVGGTCAAGVVGAALALAADCFKNSELLAKAEAITEYHVKQFAEKGYTVGGPGEILQCPDSESSFGLLESTVVLYEHTGKTAWLEKSELLAWLSASWCVSYDYPFPPESEFGIKDMRSLGSVWASVQNKHSAPGICTFSGDSLFKLYRASGNRKYLELIQEIAHNITQYLSTQERPIWGFDITAVGDYAKMIPMPAGWMSERVQLSDFSEPTGEIFVGSCWCESSCMLGCVEIPGFYLNTSSGEYAVIDHVEVLLLETTKTEYTFEFYNPFDRVITVRLFTEDDQQRKQPLGQNALLNQPTLTLTSRERRTVTFPRT